MPMSILSSKRNSVNKEFLIIDKHNRVKSCNFGHHVNSDIQLQTVEILMRRLLMSSLIRIYTVCLVYLFLFLIMKQQTRLLSDFHLMSKFTLCLKLPDFTQSFCC